MNHTPTLMSLSMGVYCFQPHITQPTRITDHTATLIDNIYFKSIDHYTISGNILSDITDHLQNFLIINKLSCNTYKPVIYRRDFSNYNEENLLEEVKLINWEDVLPVTDDVNLIFDSFHQKRSNSILHHSCISTTRTPSQRILIISLRQFVANISTVHD